MHLFYSILFQNLQYYTLENMNGMCYYHGMEKKVAKKYIISSLLIFFVSFGLTFLVSFCLTKSGVATLELTVPQMLLVSLCAGLITDGSYTGFCSLFLRVGELSTKQCVLVVVFCIPLVIFADIYGIAILLPYFIKAVRAFVKK